MKRSRLSEELIIGILKEHEAEVVVVSSPMPFELITDQNQGSGGAQLPRADRVLRARACCHNVAAAGIIEGGIGASLKRLKQKENALVVQCEFRQPNISSSSGKMMERETKSICYGIDLALRR